MSGCKISFCTVCMNRLHHLQQTLPLNITDNADYKNVEFVLLDYNSTDGLGNHIRSKYMDAIESGLLVYYQTPYPLHFNRSHSRNMAFKLATGEVVCNLDADNFAGVGFARYIAGIFTNASRVAIHAVNAAAAGPDTTGKICVRHTDFLHLGGYDEGFDGYGFEDNDFIYRLALSGVRFTTIQQPAFLQYIPHTDGERIENEKMLRLVQEVWIRYIDPATSQVLLFNLDGTFRSATIIHHYTRFCANFEKALQGKAFTGYKLSLEGGYATRGHWRREDSDVLLFYPNGPVETLQEDSGSNHILKNRFGDCFYPIAQEKQITELLFFISGAENRTRMLDNQQRKKIRVNEAGFGQGIVYKNFSDSPIAI